VIAHQPEGVKVLLGGLLIDGNGGSPVKDSTVVIQGQRIKAVGDRSQVVVPEGAEILDCSNRVVMPGMIDAHLHLQKANVAYFKNYQLGTILTTPQLLLLYSLRSAQIMLEAGFTTLRSHPHFMPFEPNSEWYGVALRDAINAGLFPGPRLLSAGGYVAITSSHFDLIASRTLPRFPGVTADGPWALREMVRKVLRAGADFIKTCLSGGGGTAQEEPDIRNMTQEEIDAIVDEAHAFNKPCSSHCFTALSQKMAVKAGIDVIDHCVFTDDEAIELMAKEGKYLCPTLSHRSDRAIEERMAHGAPPDVIAKMRKLQPYCYENFKRIHQAGIKIAMGTDTQIEPTIGTNAHELELYVMLGMTSMEAIMSATKTAAEAIWLDKVTGTLDPGKFADLIVVDGNPLHDIRILQDKEKITMVFKEGELLVDREKGKSAGVLRQPVYRGGAY